MTRLGLALLLLAACDSPPGLLVGDGGVTDAGGDSGAQPGEADATEWPTLPALGPAFVIDDMHVAEIGEDAHPFSLLGGAINPQLQQSIADGQLLLGLEVRELDDPTGTDDDSVTVGMYPLSDTDDDLTDNFDPDAPEDYVAQTGSIVAGVPVAHFTEASVNASALRATGVDLLDLLGSALPISLHNPTLEGTLVAAEDDDGPYLRELSDGRLRTALPASVLAIVPNVASGTCPGATLLDVLVGGCGYPISLQPDVDIDEDGLEKIQDTDDDGVIDTCIDGDGSVITDALCATNPAIADGYRLIFVIHGTRARIHDPGL